MNTNITEEQYQQFFTGLLAGNRPLCTRVMEGLLASDIDIIDLYVHLFQRALYETGEQWEKGRISVAVEHAATAIVERLLSIVQPKVFMGGERSHTAIIACVADEHHQVGARIVADVFELHGWRCYFLGANTPLPDLLRMVDEHQPDVVGLSLSISYNMPLLLRAYAELRKIFPEQPVIVGGQAFRHGDSDAFSADPHVQYVSSLYELKHFLKTYETT